jgi:hypothetical protein
VDGIEALLDRRHNIQGIMSFCNPKPIIERMTTGIRISTTLGMNFGAFVLEYDSLTRHVKTLGER